MYIISIANEKGGVAKTTTAISLGGALKDLGKKVLLVDLDSQASLTNGLEMKLNASQATTADVLFDAASFSNTIRTHKASGIDVAPAGENLRYAENILSSKPAYHTKLWTKLSQSNLPYDYIVLDCPAHLGAVTLNALVASNMLIIPTQTEYLPLVSLRNLLQMAKEVRSDFNQKLIYRILVTIYDTNINAHRILNSQLRSHARANIFNQIIQVDDGLRDSAMLGMPVQYHLPSSRSSEQYREVATELLDKAESKNATHHRIDELFSSFEKDNIIWDEKNLEKTLDWSWKCDQDKIFTKCGPDSENYIGIPAENFLGQSLLTFQMHPDSAQELREKLPTDVHPVDLPVLYKNNEGKWIPIRMHIYPRLGMNGELLGWGGVNHYLHDSPEIIAQKQAEFEYRISKREDEFHPASRESQPIPSALPVIEQVQQVIKPEVIDEQPDILPDPSPSPIVPPTPPQIIPPLEDVSKVIADEIPEDPFGPSLYNMTPVPMPFIPEIIDTQPVRSDKQVADIPAKTVPDLTPPIEQPITQITQPVKPAPPPIALEHTKTESQLYAKLEDERPSPTDPYSAPPIAPEPDVVPPTRMDPIQQPKNELEQINDLLQEGKKGEARRRTLTYLTDHPKNETAWMYLSNTYVMERDRGRIMDIFLNTQNHEVAVQKELETLNRQSTENKLPRAFEKADKKSKKQSKLGRLMNPRRKKRRIRPELLIFIIAIIVMQPLALSFALF